MAVRRYRDGRGRSRYAIEFQQRGVRVLRRLPPGCTATQAQEWETQLRREAFDRGTLGHSPEVLLSEVIQTWLDTKPHKNHRDLVNKANRLAPFVGSRPISEAPEVASELLSAQSGLTPATVNRRMAIIKAALGHAGRDDLARQIKLRPERNRREVYLTPKQIKALANASIVPTIKTAILIAAYTGLRASELLALGSTPSRSGTLTVSKSKSGKARTVPVPKHIRPLLRALPLGLSYWQLHKGFCEARKKAGMPHVRFHDLRHTYASMLVAQGVDLYVVGKLLGHASTQTTARYAHLQQATLRKAVDKLKG